MSAFFQWMKAHRQALIVACVMFGVMAILMVESLFAIDMWLDDIFDEAGNVVIWIWRAGGALTWPVFMWLLLRPYQGNASDDQKTLITICAIAAAYGGLGLWAVTKLLQVMFEAAEAGAFFVAPLVVAVATVVPFAYVWGFVVLYARGRTRLMHRDDDYGWVSQSAIATVVGIYVIGALIYFAMMIVAVPLALVISPLIAVGAEELAMHVTADVLAIAISTGNFASQWWAFHKVDEYFDRTTYAPQSSQVSQPSQPLRSEAPAASVPAVLPRLYCTCGQELTLDEACLPRYVAKESFCPRCGARIAH